MFGALLVIYGLGLPIWFVLGFIVLWIIGIPKRLYLAIILSLIWPLVVSIIVITLLTILVGKHIAIMSVNIKEWS